MESDVSLREIEIILSKESFKELQQITKSNETYEEYVEKQKNKPLKALFG